MTNIGFTQPTNVPCRLRDYAIRLEEMEIALCGWPPKSVNAADLPSSAVTGNGRYIRAAIHGCCELPYVGELARDGKLRRFAQLFADLDRLRFTDAQALRSLLPALERIDVALRWLPAEGHELLAGLQHRARSWLRNQIPCPLPNISRRFQFSVETSGGRRYQIAQGRLGVPGRVQVHGSTTSHRSINQQFPGDDAGHLIGKRFGAPDSAANLVPMNRSSNRGVFNYAMEDAWARMMTRGYGIDATIEAVFQLDEVRPFKWRATWTEISPNGHRKLCRTNLLFGNFPAQYSSKGEHLGS